VEPNDRQWPKALGYPQDVKIDVSSVGKFGSHSKYRLTHKPTKTTLVFVISNTLAESINERRWKMLHRLADMVASKPGSDVDLDEGELT